MLRVNGEYAIGNITTTGAIQREVTPMDGVVEVVRLDNRVVTVTIRDGYFPDDWSVSLTLVAEVLIARVREAMGR